MEQVREKTQEEKQALYDTTKAQLESELIECVGNENLKEEIENKLKIVEKELKP